MNKYWVVVLLLGVFVQNIEAQSGQLANTPVPDYNFMNYLISGKQYSEALFLISKHEQRYSLLDKNADTLLFLKGKVFYQQQKLQPSSDALLDISEKFHAYNGVRFLAAYNNAHIGQYEKSNSVFLGIAPTDSIQRALKNFELAANALLVKDYNTFKTYYALVPDHHLLLEEKLKLNNVALKIRDFNPKSPFLAGLMSAVIPGSGKMYAGKIGEGVTALLGLSLLGAITYENYKKAGPDNYKTIIFGSMFTVFYVSNIYGSVYSVKVYRDEFYKSVNHAVLFNMHIPVRNVFPELFN